jgi:hypothetical protein
MALFIDFSQKTSASSACARLRAEAEVGCRVGNEPEDEFDGLNGLVDHEVAEAVVLIVPTAAAMAVNVIVVVETLLLLVHELHVRSTLTVLVAPVDTEVQDQRFGNQDERNGKTSGTKQVELNSSLCAAILGAARHCWVDSTSGVVGVSGAVGVNDATVERVLHGTGGQRHVDEGVDQSRRVVTAKHAVGAVVPVDGPLVKDEEQHVSEESERKDHHGDALEDEIDRLAEVDSIGRLEEDTENHLRHTEDHGELHLHGVLERERVFSVVPARVETEGIHGAHVGVLVVGRCKVP